MADELAVNLEDVAAEIGKLSDDDLKKDLLDIRVRQKVQQKKHYNPEKMKEYQRKGRERARAMKERALNTPSHKHNPETGRLFSNLWEEINHSANVEAEKRVTTQAVADTTEGDE